MKFRKKRIAVPQPLSQDKSQSIVVVSDSGFLRIMVLHEARNTPIEWEIARAG